MYVLDTDASDFALGAVLQQEQDDGKLRHRIWQSDLVGARAAVLHYKKGVVGRRFGLKKYRQHLLGREIII